MEILLLVIVIILIVYQNIGINSKLESTQFRLKELENLLNNLKLGSTQPKIENKEELKEKAITETLQPAVMEVPLPIIEEEIEEFEEEEDEIAHPVFSTFQTVGSYELSKLEMEKKGNYASDATDLKEEEIEENAEKLSWMDNFSKSNPDLERFIGENLISKIGIAILVLGIAFFVKYAIDQNWINEAARAGIGFLAGGIVLGVANKLRKEFKAFSSVLVSGGIAIFYFTLAIAFHEYHLFSQTAAFIGMVLVTGFSIYISLQYNRQELAVLSLVGGFATPLMLSTGEGNYVVLFSYLLILDLGMLVVSYYRNWNLVNGLTYLFTLLFYFGWFQKTFNTAEENLPYLGGFLFATGFYFVFLFSNLINQIKEKRPFRNYELSLLLSNTFLYFAAGMYMVNGANPELKGMFTIGFAIVNLLVTYFVSKNYKIDSRLFYLLIGITLTFVTLAAPIQLSGNYITLFWAAETSLLIWLAQKSKIELYRFSSLLVFVLSVSSLLLDWADIYRHSEDLLILINQAFLSSVFVLFCIGFYIYLLQKEETQHHDFYGIVFKNNAVANTIKIIMILIAYLTGFLELNYHINKIYQFDVQVNSLLLVYHFLFSLVFIYGCRKIKEKWLDPIQGFVGLINILLMIVLLFPGVLKELSILAFDDIHFGTSYWAHYFVLIPFVIQMIWLYPLAKNTTPTYTAWGLTVLLTLFSSLELLVQTEFIYMPKLKALGMDSPVLYETLFNFDSMIYKSGFPILWGIIAFTLLSFGIKRAYKNLRIAALSLIGLTIAKLFIYDIRNVSEGGKIAAFILLGVVLLIISFTYQKIKAIILEEEGSKNEENSI
jgi:uncharacterized membrane protein